MADALLKSFSFVLLILLGYFLKTRKIFGEQDYRVLTAIIMNITLPAAVITGFAGLKMSASLLFVMLLGLCANLLLILFGWFVSRKKPVGQIAFSMLNYPGYNIGAFAIPYLQAFLGSTGVVVASMFDTGNAVMCTGGSYAVTSAVISKDGEKQSLLSVLKKPFSSVTFNVYMLLFVTSLAGLAVPQWLINLLSPAANANPGLAMLMIGLMFRWDSKPGYLRAAAGAVVTRNLFGVAATLLVYFFTPLAPEVKQVVALLLFAPMSVISTAYTEKCGGDAGLAGFTNSLSILVSLFVMTGIVLFI